jgi:hypothetical protein
MVVAIRGIVIVRMAVAVLLVMTERHALARSHSRQALERERQG